MLCVPFERCEAPIGLVVMPVATRCEVTFTLPMLCVQVEKGEDPVGLVVVMDGICLDGLCTYVDYMWSLHMLCVQVEKGEGPVGLVVAPTRELAEQIHKEARKFAKPYRE